VFVCRCGWADVGAADTQTALHTVSARIQIIRKGKLAIHTFSPHFRLMVVRLSIPPLLNVLVYASTISVVNPEKHCSSL
jgi:hypothetical protein